MNSTTTRRYDQKLANGTSKQGEVFGDYATMLGAFGEPDLFPSDYLDGKINTRWVFSTAFGIMTIYAYKPTVNREDQFQWSVGGKSSEVVDVARQMIYEKTGVCPGCGYHVTRCKQTDICYDQPSF